MNIPGFSEYIVYVDESGDHGLASIDDSYPVFVLAFCVFSKEQYVEELTKQVQNFKFKHFGHDMIVLHEHEIRKTVGPFQILFNKERRDVFYDDLNSIIVDAPLTIISAFVDKRKFRKKMGVEHNLYHVALSSCLRRLQQFLEKESQKDVTHLVFEARGKKEDRELELEFRRLCSSHGYSFDIVVAKKGINSCGLQVADLVARPIGRFCLNPEQPNRTYETLEKKFAKGRNGEADGLGLEKIP